eukprot:TRINITY_DN12605_c0_g1_i2.p1 TRINITY_DN12605_c0_g1~~TRINITY_DN12605_c0_g1_i2.p1  ORF type:complete len:189 (-),score=51.49 TRINITY_DN12605_c0_g1_i2:246-812(-)
MTDDQYQKWIKIHETAAEKYDNQAKDLLKNINLIELDISKENSELQKITKKINIADEKLEETEYGIRRRRGTLISLQKMSDKRLQRFGFDKTKLIPVENNEAKELGDDECLEKENKEVTFEEILHRSNIKHKEKIESDNNNERQKNVEKIKLDFRRKLITFKRTVRSVENHCEDIENKISCKSLKLTK